MRQKCIFFLNDFEFYAFYACDNLQNFFCIVESNSMRGETSGSVTLGAVSRFGRTLKTPRAACLTGDCPSPLQGTTSYVSCIGMLIWCI